MISWSSVTTFLDILLLRNMISVEASLETALGACSDLGTASCSAQLLSVSQVPAIFAAMQAANDPVLTSIDVYRYEKPR